MQSQDPVLLRQYQRASENRIANEINSRMSPSVNQGPGKLSHSPGHWKKYITSESNLRSPKRRETNYSNSNAEQRYQFTGRQPIKQQGQESQISKFQEQKRRKEDMMRRVEEIQKKVTPILNYQRNNEEVDENFGWNNRMEQRILKLQTHIDMIQKQMQIKIERRLLEVQREWNARIELLLSPQNQRKLNRVSTTEKLHSMAKTQENGKHDEMEDQRYRRPPTHTVGGQAYRTYNYDETNKKQTNNEGYFTKREHEREEEDSSEDLR